MMKTTIACVAALALAGAAVAHTSGSGSMGDSAGMGNSMASSTTKSGTMPKHHAMPKKTTAKHSKKMARSGSSMSSTDGAMSNSTSPQ